MEQINTAIQYNNNYIFLKRNLYREIFTYNFFNPRSQTPIWEHKTTNNEMSTYNHFITIHKFAFCH